eukprot:6511652-Lingulodinium_polyedra.AAC.1
MQRVVRQQARFDLASQHRPPLEEVSEAARALSLVVQAVVPLQALGQGLPTRRRRAAKVGGQRHQEPNRPLRVEAELGCVLLRQSLVDLLLDADRHRAIVW